MADGLKKVGVPLPTKVFGTVNGNVAAYNNNCSPVVAPKFKISRGTQANTVVQKNVTKLSPSPPVPVKPAVLSKQPRLPAPPVPPKPGSALKAPSPTKPALAPKPVLPPKPTVRPYNSVPSSRDPIASPTRPQRSRDHVEQTEKSIPKLQDRLPISSAQLVVKQHSSRKSASLGRIEGVRCCTLLARETNDRCLQRDSGFISCSLENVGQSAYKSVGHYTDIPLATSPIAPPRRRRKSADNYEPIYAVVDFSKKRNRRFLNTEGQPTDSNLEQPVEKLTAMEAHDVGSTPIEGNVPILPRDCSQLYNDGEDAVSSTTDYASLEACSLSETVTSSQMDSDIEMIENSFATIASLIESFNHTADSAKAPRCTVTKEPEILRNTASSTASASAKNQVDQEDNDVGQTVIARLVFGGTVVQQTDLLPVILKLIFPSYRFR